MKVKICGITRLSDALFCAQAGVWAVGFNCYEKSPRYIGHDKIKKITMQLPASLLKIGIFVSASACEILRALEILDFVQIYHDMKLSLTEKKRVIFSLQAESVEDLPPVSLLNTYGYVLLDAPKQQCGLMGGTGRLARWDLAAQLAKDYPLILAGGLNKENVREAIRYVQPCALDVASSVEESPGIKNHIKIRELLRRC